MGYYRELHLHIFPLIPSFTFKVEIFSVDYMARDFMGLGSKTSPVAIKEDDYDETKDSGIVLFILNILFFS